MVDADAVGLGDAGDGLLDLLVGHAHASALGLGDLQLEQDQALEHLALEHVARRQLFAAAGVLAQDVGDRAVELGLEDDVLVHDRSDPVDRLQFLGLGDADQQAAGQDASGQGTGKTIVHRVGSRMASSPPGPRFSRLIEGEGGVK